MKTLAEQTELLQPPQAAVLVLPHQGLGDRHLGGDLGQAVARQVALEHLPPETLADSIAQKGARIAAIMEEVKSILGARPVPEQKISLHSAAVGAGA